MPNLKIHPQADEGRIVEVTPQSAGWTYVGFDLWKLKPGQKAQGGDKGREVCLVFISGKGQVTAGVQDFGTLGGRSSPFEGKPWSVYVPAGVTWSVTAGTDVTLPCAQHRARASCRPGSSAPMVCIRKHAARVPMCGM